MKRQLILIFTIFLSTNALFAQKSQILSDTARMEKLADSLHLEYRFADADSLYTRLASHLKDSSYIMGPLEDKRMRTANAQSLLGFVSTPDVIAKQKFSIKDFFLFYPLPDKTWRPVPNKLDSLSSEPLITGMYAPADAERIYYSAEDLSHARNIYMTEYQDSLWSVPALLTEEITSSSNEIYPMLSNGGRSLYFASNGLYGVGGYDLFVSHWNDELGEWGAPENLGFPYSSPYDDFLYINTSDGKYSIFASNRECSRDSVYVYVIEYDSMPVRSAMTSAQAKETALLEPTGDHAKMDHSSAASSKIDDSSEIREYIRMMEQVRALRDTIDTYNAVMDKLRNEYAVSSDADERAALTGSILRREAMLPRLQDSLKKVTGEVQKIEMEFLFKGVVIDPAALAKEADKEVVGAKLNYAFVKQTMGKKLDIKLAEPEKKFDYSFQILDVAQMAENQELPEGLVYQIQILSQTREASLKHLKGLSPVFLARPSSSRYVYKVGLFHTYADVLSHLNSVKRLGFKSAFIVAFDNGKSINVAKAKQLEKERADQEWQVTLTPGPEFSAEEAQGIVKTLTDNEVTRLNMAGQVVFVVSGFKKQADADSFASLAKAGGFSEAVIKKL